MSVQLLSILILASIFVLATALPIHMGALAMAAAFAFGMWVLPGDFEAKVDQIVNGFPGDLFILLAGVTYLFAIAKNNGTIDWLVHSAVRSVRGRITLIPWVMFFASASLSALGAVGGTGVAMLAPIGIDFALRYRINPVLVGLMIINGGTAGAFSPIGIFGLITNSIVEGSGLETSPPTLFVVVLAFNLLLGAVTVFLFGKTRTMRNVKPNATRVQDDGALPPPPALNLYSTLTLAGLLALAIGALFFELHVGFSAFVLAVVLSAIHPAGAKGAVNQIAWSTVLLICGIVTYVSLMNNLGTIDYLGDFVAGISVALVGALAICYIGGIISAFTSTTGILGALIPLAVPFLERQELSAIGLIAALAISASAVDSTPFSTSGALVIANVPEEQRELVYHRLVQWGFSMVALAPLTAWLILVVPGWL